MFSRAGRFLLLETQFPPREHQRARRREPLEIWPPAFSRRRFLSTCPMCTASLGGSHIHFVKLSLQTAESSSLYLTSCESCVPPRSTENVFLQGLFWFTSQKSPRSPPPTALEVCQTQVQSCVCVGRRVSRTRPVNEKWASPVRSASSWYRLHTAKLADFRNTIRWTLTSVQLCNHHHNHDVKHFRHPKKFPLALNRFTGGCSSFLVVDSLAFSA